MASNAKRQTTMAKRAREQAVREKRERKAERRAARHEAAAAEKAAAEAAAAAGEPVGEGDETAPAALDADVADAPPETSSA